MSKSPHSGRKRRLLIMFGLTLSYMLAELIVGYLAESLALVADSFHMLSDVISLIVAFISILLSPKKWKKSTFGWSRAEVLGALVNSVFLMALCFSILAESVQRFILPKAVTQPRMVLGVGIGGLLINLIGLCLFREGHGHSHKKSVIQHQGRLTRLVVPEEDDNSSSHELLIQEIPVNEATEKNAGFTDGTISEGGINSPTKSKQSDERDEPVLKNTTTIMAETDMNGTVLPMSANQSEAAAPPKPTESSQPTGDSPKCQKPSHDKKAAEKKVKGSHQLNMHGVFLHILADTLGSVIVIISASVIWATEEQRKSNPNTYKFVDYVDPLLSVIMVFLIILSAWPLLQETSMILLQTVPGHIQIEEMKRSLMEEVPQIIGIHEFHVWQLAGDRIIASIHIVCHDVKDYIRISRDAKYFFHINGIHSTTIQAEFLDYETSHFDEKDCLLNCPKNGRNASATCISSSCCGANGNYSDDGKK